MEDGDKDKMTNTIDNSIQVGASLFASNIGSEHFIGRRRL